MMPSRVKALWSYRSSRGTDCTLAGTSMSGVSVLVPTLERSGT
jgi:hypothetical protein